MNTEIISRCGYRCDLCPAYKMNIKNKEDQRKVSDNWHKYYGFRINPERIMCDGCLTDDSKNPNLISKKCAVRKCVNKMQISNCAYCEQYVCKKLMGLMVDVNEIEKKYGSKIPEDDYKNYIKPYESKQRLDAIRDR